MMNAFIKKILAACALLSIGNYLHAQINAGDALQQQFANYQQHNYQEKLFLHTDKTFYLAGENIWFKIYCLDEVTHQLSPLSKVAYVEVISKENKAVLQAKIQMENGSGNGSFIIPSYTSSGNYLLRAYTSLMKNMDAGYFFQQQITIVNTLKSSSIDEPQKKDAYDVQFFPEGGNLVEGIASAVAFKAVDINGKGVECSGTVVDNDNRTIASFQSMKFGMGSFSFTPVRGATYKAIIKIGDAILQKPLPQVYTNGYTMHLEKEAGDNLRISVQTNIADQDNAVYLFVQSKNMAKQVQAARFVNGSASFIVSSSQLSEGISQFTIFNSSKKPVCERLYFKKPVQKLNVHINADKNEYSSRKPVTINIENAVNANMSLSVFMIDSLQPLQYNDIFSYLLLSSELKGSIESPEYYFQNSNEADEAADNLVLTQGWRRFKWEELLQDKKPYFEFLPEAEGILVSGKITGRNNGKPAANISATLTVPGENFQLATAISNANGDVKFNVKNFYSSSNIIIQADSNYKVDIVSSYSDKFTSATTPSLILTEQWKQQLLQRSIHMQAENAYLAGQKQRTYIFNAADTAAFYGKPDQRYYLDDYTRFMTMEEVMREYVTDVRLRKESQQFHFKVHNLVNNTFFDDDPLILLDGLPLANTNRIMDFDPLKIKRLDVVSRKYYYGNIATNGIVSYTTYKGDLAEFPLTAGEMVIEYDGLQREREFYNPVYNTAAQAESRIPDFRNVLYWAPQIKTGADGKTQLTFFTSDLSGKFACVLQGITNEGLAGSSVISFNVVK